MIKILDSNGNLFGELDNDTFNNLNKESFAQSITPNSKLLYSVIVYDPDSDSYSLAYIMSRLPDAINTLNNTINNIQLAPGPKGPQGIAGLAGKDGINGKDGAKGATGAIGPAGPTGATGATGAKGADSTVAGPVGPQGVAGVPTRVERYTTFSTDANGVVTGTFSSAFATVPDCDVIDTWTTANPSQRICGAITSVSLIGFTAQIMTSQPIVLLNGSPYAKAGAGIKPIIRAIGR